MIKHPRSLGTMISPPSRPRTICRRERGLAMLFERLQGLFGGASSFNNRLPVAFVGGSEPHVVIYNMSGEISARVTIDPENGLYVFCELDRAAGIVLATASEERLIDEIVAHLSASDDNPVPHGGPQPSAFSSARPWRMSNASSSFRPSVTAAAIQPMPPSCSAFL